MGDAIAWTSLGVSAAALVFTVVFNLLSYKRQHLPQVTMQVRRVSVPNTDERGVHADYLHAVELNAINTGSRQVELAEIHVEIHGIGAYWPHGAYGKLDLPLAPGKSQRWTEVLHHYYRRLKEKQRMTGEAIPFRVRAKATTAEGRVFRSDWLEIEHFDPAAGDYQLFGPLQVEGIMADVLKERTAG